ncbi:MAG: hypothetical protein H5T50_08720 [Nitrososphaeria archaeon]|nr:hypothetical protein [Nitrososphaeria archaeon]
MSSFRRLENRILLRRMLSERGFNVRMHSYEYYVIRDKFVSVIFLEPEFNRVLVHKISWNPKNSSLAVKEIYSIIKEIDPSIEVHVEEDRES